MEKPSKDSTRTNNRKRPNENNGRQTCQTNTKQDKQTQNTNTAQQQIEQYRR